jgi:EAL domain-containing protein (putative c-di-GMP-specific phosphodiesterase class I)
MEHRQKTKWTKDEMAKAIRCNEFIPFFQPKIDLATGTSSCVEILARWNHPDLGILPPSQFISLVEQAGLIDEFTDSLFRQSLLNARNNKLMHGVGMAMNFSSATLQNPRVSSRICSMVSEHGIPFDQITIEVTETTFPENYSSVLKSLSNLRTKGFHISIDDFGTGYSSLKLLSKFPFTELKIDRIFIAGISKDRKLTEILETIVQLARKLHLSTVAEGIETKAQLDFIQNLGCNVGQGFYFSAAMKNFGAAMRNVVRRKVREETLLAAA